LTAILVLLVLLLLNTDSLTMVGILAAIIVVFGLAWVGLRARQSDDLPVNATAVMRTIKHHHKPALLVFVSEFSLGSMLLGSSAARLEGSQPKDFKVYRMSINREPGRALFDQFGGRVTPMYVLVDGKGNKVDAWTFVLPKDRVMSEASQHQTT